MTGLARILVLSLSLALGACAIHPPPATLPAHMCNFVQWPLEIALPSVPQPSAAQPATPAPQQGLAEDISYALNNAVVAEQPLAVLALSGGSQHGSFGAGFLDGWRTASNGQLPDFAVVTGISTGAIISTFAFIGDTAAPVRGYSITDESQLLTPIVRMRNGHASPQSMLQVVRRGAVADLDPLRQVLRGEMTEEVLRRVAMRHMNNRRLYVGVVDVDTGQAVALDMGEMATRYFVAQDDAARTRVRNCYVEAIVASSSVPLAALPVFLDNHMYVDGGARFGMFAEDVIRGVRQHNKNARTQTPIYVIANGDLETAPACGKVDEALCAHPNPGSGGSYGAHSDWSLLGLAQRSEDILVNQVYRFSASVILGRDTKGDRVYFARIGADALSHRFTLSNPTLGSGTQTCSEWRRMDHDTLHPLQFHPRYMRCLIDYGRSRAADPQRRWDQQPAADMPVAPEVPKP